MNSSDRAEFPGFESSAYRGKPVAGSGSDLLNQACQLAATWLSLSDIVICFSPDGPARTVFCRNNLWSRQELAEARLFFGEPTEVSIADGSLHRQFRASHLFTGNRGIRAGASIPLKIKIWPASWLIAFTQQPRQWTRQDLDVLRQVSTVAANELQRPWSDVGVPGLLSDGAVWPTFPDFLEHAADLVFTCDLSGRVTSINRSGENLLGYPAGSLPDRLHVSEMAAREHRTTLRQMLLDQLGGGRQQHHHCLIESKTGERVPLRVILHLLFQEGRPAGVIGFGKRSTPLVEASTEPPARAHALWIELRRLHETNFGSCNDWLREALTAVRQALSLDSALLFHEQRGGLELRITSPGRATGGAEAIEAHALGFCREALDLTGAREFRNCAGIAVPVIACPIKIGSRSIGLIWGLRSTAEAVNEIDKAFLESVAVLAGGYLADERFAALRRDPVTRLPNEIAFRERFAALQRVQHGNDPMGILVVDVDGFNNFKLRFGHGAADSLLFELARRLEARVPDRRMLACLGTDRFAVVLPSVSHADEVRALGRKLLEAVRQPLSAPYDQITITASAGAALSESGRESGTNLIRKAVTALTLVKHSGQGDIEVYAGPVSEFEGPSDPYETDLRAALENKELTLLFQPQVNLDGELYGFEVLMAWNHPRLGRLPASRFVDVAEKSGLIVPIGAWVIEESFRHATEWARRRPGLRLAVNISTRQLERDDFFELVQHSLRESGADPNLIELEVTESSLMSNLPNAASVIQRLRDHGLRVAIDDFGTGYSSLSYLLRLPVDTLKIDRSFLCETDPPKSVLPVVQAIVTLAHHLGLSVVGEGVETEEQFRLLTTAGCDRFQGHLVSRPLERDRAERLMGNEGVFFQVSGQ